MPIAWLCVSTWNYTFNGEGSSFILFLQFYSKDKIVDVLIASLSAYIIVYYGFKNIERENKR